ncbi:hypothetical protein, partial [Klebsiella pneumoniae]|uniref:hypothetical protein n=1 Tax=Klebsiella pneumoniae TaxID=573 RepID=UPI0022AC8A54
MSVLRTVIGPVYNAASAGQPGLLTFTRSTSYDAGGTYAGGQLRAYVREDDELYASATDATPGVE